MPVPKLLGSSSLAANASSATSTALLPPRRCPTAPVDAAAPAAPTLLTPAPLPLHWSLYPLPHAAAAVHADAAAPAPPLHLPPHAAPAPLPRRSAPLTLQPRPCPCCTAPSAPALLHPPLPPLPPRCCPTAPTAMACTCPRCPHRPAAAPAAPLHQLLHPVLPCCTRPCTRRPPTLLAYRTRPPPRRCTAAPPAGTLSAALPPTPATTAPLALAVRHLQLLHQAAFLPHVPENSRIAHLVRPAVPDVRSPPVAATTHGKLELDVSTSPLDHGPPPSSSSYLEARAYTHALPPRQHKGTSLTPSLVLMLSLPSSSSSPTPVPLAFPNNPLQSNIL
ncbi:hypothetical protein B0H14DRAFT_3901971 [Mycena olivaceomarginata]|nr:hypothetical protein B0H14DRAFT_3901971 [Mycena olivaceomarginata]